MVHKIEVFTSPTCPHCPGAVQVVEIDYGVHAVPAIAINNSLAFIGAPTLEELLERLE